MTMILALVLSTGLLFSPSIAQAKRVFIHCPKVTTMDIKTKEKAIQSCDTAFITKKGVIKRMPAKIVKKYKYNKG